MSSQPTQLLPPSELDPDDPDSGDRATETDNNAPHERELPLLRIAITVVALLLSIVSIKWFGAFIGIILVAVTLTVGTIFILLAIKPGNPMGQLDDPDLDVSNVGDVWPLPSHVKLFRVPKPSVATLRDGGKYFVVKHWKEIIPLKTSWSKLLTIAVIVWCFYELLVQPWLSFAPRLGSKVYLATLVLPLAWIAVRVLIFTKFQVKFNYGVATQLGIMTHKGWLRPMYIFIAIDKFSDQTVTYPTLLYRILRLHVGDIYTDTAGMGQNLPLQQVAWAVELQAIYQDLINTNAQGNYDFGMRQREILEELLPAILSLGTEIGGASQQITNLLGLIGTDLDRQIGANLRRQNELSVEANQWSALLAYKLGTTQAELHQFVPAAARNLHGFFPATPDPPPPNSAPS